MHSGLLPYSSRVWGGFGVARVLGCFVWSGRVREFRLSTGTTLCKGLILWMGFRISVFGNDLLKDMIWNCSFGTCTTGIQYPTEPKERSPHAPPSVDLA